MTIGWKAMYWKAGDQPDSEIACSECKLPGKLSQHTRMFFFHVLGIPLIPISGKRKIVKCGYCTSTFRADKVDFDRSQQVGVLIGAQKETDTR